MAEPVQGSVVSERAVKEIAASEFFAFLGEARIRRVAEVAEQTGVAEVVNNGRWLNPSARQNVLRVLAPELSSVSETYAWMVVRRYRDLKRWYIEQEMLAEKKKQEEEAKAKLAAEKAAKAAAAKKAAEAKPAEAKPAEAKPASESPKSDVNAQVPADQAARTSPPDPHNASPAAADPAKDAPKPS